MTPCLRTPLLSLLVASALAALGPVAGQAGDPEAEKIAAKGGEILTQQCSRCHATTKTGDSPLAAAPPFRTLSAKYPIDSLAEALAEGITTGHPDMPEFVFSTDEIAAILAYMESISEPAAKAR